MPIVPQHLRGKIRRHLGYTRPRAVNPATLSQLEAALNSIDSNDDIYGTTGPSIVVLLDRCDRLFRMTDPTDTLVYSQLQTVLGDVNRTTQTRTIDDALKKNREVYYKATDDLAFFLNVPNLARPQNAHQLFVNLGSSYVLAPPGAADTAISDRVYLNYNYA